MFARDFRAMTGTTLTDRFHALTEQSIEQCYHCHKCRAGCPILPAMDYGPDRILRLLQLGQWERVLTSRDIWLCLGCEMCGAHCPNGIDVGEIMIALREIAAEQGYRREDCDELRDRLRDELRDAASYPVASTDERPDVDDRLCAGVQRLNQLSQTLVTAHNISGDDNVERLIWSQNLPDVPAGLARKPEADLVYFVGCVGAFFPRSYRVPQALTRTLEAAHADFTTLGGEEWCCGYPLFALGEKERAAELARHNVAQVEALGTARLVTTCPSCYHTWKHLYPDLLGREPAIEVLHAAELLADLVSGGDLALGELPARVTYHDPCDLGRKSQVYDAPRRVLRSIPGLTFVEMNGWGQISECCGGGGNVESFDPDAVSGVAHHRIDRACEVEADMIVSACQQCERTLMGAVRRHKEARRARMRVLDLTELVWQAIESGQEEEA
jgi:heterodisulfide reductase subunit D